MTHFMKWPKLFDRHLKPEHTTKLRWDSIDISPVDYNLSSIYDLTFIVGIYRYK